MTEKEKTARQIKVMQAYIDGREVQYELSSGWATIPPSSPVHWNWGICNYRIKPQEVFLLWGKKGQVLLIEDEEEAYKLAAGNSYFQIQKVEREDPPEYAGKYR